MIRQKLLVQKKLDGVYMEECLKSTSALYIHQELERRTKNKDKNLRECCHCCTLHHPNIVQFLELLRPPSTSQSGSSTRLPVLDERQDEKLKSYVETAEQSNTTIPYLSKLSLLRDVAQCLRYLHHNSPMIHHDLP